MNTPTFEQFSDFLRSSSGLSPKTVISPTTRLEADLGMTGDDGDDLLKETEKEYAVSLSTPQAGYRLTFGLKNDEYLFHSEGFNLFKLFPSKEKVVEFTAGQLYDAVMKQKSKQTVEPTRDKRVAHG